MERIVRNFTFTGFHRVLISLIAMRMLTSLQLFLRKYVRNVHNYYVLYTLTNFIHAFSIGEIKG